MKSVLFSCYGLGIGGIEKCLVNLINAMPEDEFDITSYEPGIHSFENNQAKSEHTRFV